MLSNPTIKFDLIFGCFFLGYFVVNTWVAWKSKVSVELLSFGDWKKENQSKLDGYPDYQDVHDAFTPDYLAKRHYLNYLRTFGIKDTTAKQRLKGSQLISTEEENSFNYWSGIFAKEFVHYFDVFFHKYNDDKKAVEMINNWLENEVNQAYKFACNRVSKIGVKM